MWIYCQLWSIKLWINFAIMCYSSECCLQAPGPGRHVGVSAVLDHGLGEMCFCFKSKYVCGTCCWWILFFVFEFAGCSTTINKGLGLICCKSWSWVLDLVFVGMKLMNWVQIKKCKSEYQIFSWGICEDPRWSYNLIKCWKTTPSLSIFVMVFLICNQIKRSTREIKGLSTARSSVWLNVTKYTFAEADVNWWTLSFIIFGFRWFL